MNTGNLVSFLGMFVLMALAWAVSTSRRNVNWRVVFWGVVLQLAFGILVFHAPGSTELFVFINHAVTKLLDSACAGARFVLGRLALPPGTTNDAGETSLGFILAFQGFPMIVFFSALMAILYYYGIVQAVIRGFAWVFTKLMRISGAESLCAASNIFVGVESALTVRPYIERMRRSELCAILTAGMATVASNVLALYVFFLHREFPNIAGHLVSASILSAPAAVVMSKLLAPEDGAPATLGSSVKFAYDKESSVFEAIIKGSNAGVQLIFGIVAVLLAVLGLMALVDLVLAAVGGRVNVLAGWHGTWSLKALLGWVFYPLAVVMGVPPEDSIAVARIVGERTVAAELVAYQDLAAALASGAIRDPRSAIIATYALCGLAHVASLAIFVGGISALAPSRTKDLAAVGVRALVAATLACRMTACVAGTLAGDTTVLLGNAGVGARYGAAVAMRSSL